MINAAVLGSPISHSLSPLLHQTAYSLLGIDGSYSAIDVKGEELIEFIEGSLNQDWRGFNLTMPLKERIFDSQVVNLDERATLIRSANTLIREGSRYRGYSTDLAAFERLLEPYSVEKVAIIGAGGTARAALGALSGRCDHVDVLLRNPNRIEHLEKIDTTIAITPLPLTASLEGYEVVINATPSGVADHFAEGLTSPGLLLLESLYNPWPTELSFAWRQLGGKVIHGIDLLVEQALDAIALMTERDFDYSTMRKELLSVALGHLNPH
jgi:shikimate dehydrogenase